MTSPKATGRILIVDDQKADRSFLCQILRDLGHDLIEAKDGTEALEMAAELEPDLVLLDVMMPGMDGYAVCRSLRDDPDTQSIPVFMISALCSDEDRINGFESGATEYLPKPIDVLELRLRVANTLRQVSRTRELEKSLREMKRLERVRDEWATYVVNELDEKLTQLEASTDTEDALTAQARELTTTLLDCRKLQDVKSQVQIKGCDLNDIAAEVTQSHPGAIEMRELQGSVEADPKLLTRLFSQLLTAAEHQADGAITITSQDQYDGNLLVDFFCEGSGIWHEAFTTLERGSINSKVQDCQNRLELNLAFCRHAIDLMEGSIGVEAIPGHGIRFWMTLPIDESAVDLPNVIAFVTEEIAYDDAVSR